MAAISATYRLWHGRGMYKTLWDCSKIAGENIQFWVYVSQLYYLEVSAPISTEKNPTVWSQINTPSVWCVDCRLVYLEDRPPIPMVYLRGPLNAVSRKPLPKLAVHHISKGFQRSVECLRIYEFFILTQEHTRTFSNNFSEATKQMLSTNLWTPRKLQQKATFPTC